MTLLSEVYNVIHNYRGLNPRASIAQCFKSNHDYDMNAIIARFTNNVTSGYTPVSVQFTDTSIGGAIVSYLWNFGDGSTSTEKNPSHTYTTPGNFTVTLTVNGPGGLYTEVLTKTGLITTNSLAIGTTYEGGIYAGNIGAYRIVCSPAGGTSVQRWKTSNTDTAGAASNTDGYQNTADMIAQGAANYPAANFCNNLTIGGYTDWYMPARNELLLLFQNKAAIGGFADDYYNSSTEHPDYNFRCWMRFMGSGSEGYNNKDSAYYVRAVRRVLI